MLVDLQIDLNPSSLKDQESLARNTVRKYLTSLFCKKMLLSDLGTSLPVLSHEEHPSHPKKHKVSALTIVQPKDYARSQESPQGLGQGVNW